MGLSIRGMAAALGVSKSQVARDSAEGMPMDDVAAAQAWRAKHRDVSRTVEGRIDRAQTPAPAAAPAAAGTEDDDPTPDDTVDYRKARTEREQIRRDSERLELNRKLGQSIDAAEAARLAYTSFRVLRDAVFNVPARVAQQCAAETDPLRIEQLLDAELSAAFGQVNPDRLLAEIETDDEDG